MADNQEREEAKLPGQWVMTCGCGCVVNVKNAGVLRSQEPCEHCADLSEELDGLVATELGWCGCGPQERIDELMIAYLTSGEDPYPTILKVEDDASLLISFVADDLGWTEHGGSVYGAWLTDEGRTALSNLRSARRASA